MKTPEPPRKRILRARECQKVVGVSRSTWFDWNNPASPRYDDSCPRRVRLGPRCVGWFEHELIAWLEAKQA